VRPPKTTTRVAIDVVFGLAAILFYLLAGIYTGLFVLLTPVIAMKVVIATAWLVGLFLVLWVWLTRGWPAFAVSVGAILVLLALASAAQSIRPISFGY
jgi:hypothetical protein